MVGKIKLVSKVRNVWCNIMLCLQIYVKYKYALY